MNFLCKTYGHDFSARRGDCRTCVVCGENEVRVIAGSAPDSLASLRGINRPRGIDPKAIV